MPAPGVTFNPCIAVTDIPNVPNTLATVIKPRPAVKDNR